VSENGSYVDPANAGYRAANAGYRLQVATHGSNVNVPAETVLTYRLDRPIDLNVADTGYTRNGRHYHRIY